MSREPIPGVFITEETDQNIKITGEAIHDSEAPTIPDDGLFPVFPAGNKDYIRAVLSAQPLDAVRLSNTRSNILLGIMLDTEANPDVRLKSIALSQREDELRKTLLQVEDEEVIFGWEK